jgi:hypothetical protein
MSSIRVLSSEVVDAVLDSLPSDDLVDLMRRVFVALASRNNEVVDCPPRTTVHSANHATLFMPSRISTAGGTGIKVVSVPLSDSNKAGLPATTMVLNEVTGAVDAIVNAKQLTAVRNAAGMTLFAVFIFGNGYDCVSPSRICTCNTASWGEKTSKSRPLRFWRAGFPSRQHIPSILPHYLPLYHCQPLDW